MTAFNATSYDVQRPTGRCALTGRELAPGEAYMATLVELSDEALAAMQEQATAENRQIPAATLSLGLLRMDICQEAWEQGQRPQSMFSYWKTVHPEPQAKRRLFVDDAVLVGLFTRLGDETQPQRLAFRYVLALVLLRKKLLRYDGVVRQAQDSGEEQVFWQVTPKLDLSKGPLGKWDDSRQMLVLDPHLDESGMQEITGQLGEILDGDL